MTPADDALGLLGDAVPVSRETRQRLERYVALLLRWQRRINLIAPSTVPDVWRRHIVDCAQLVRFLPDGARVADVGAGAGLPGLVLAAFGRSAGLREVVLVESNQKKAAFLREAAREIAPDIDVAVHAERIEAMADVLAGEIDVVTARALAPLPRLLTQTHALVENGAIGLFPKGRDAMEELTRARESWKLDLDIQPSLIAPEGRVFIVRQAHPMPRPGADDRGESP